MTRRIDTPTIDRRTATDVEHQLRAAIPHYTPEWPAEHDDRDPGLALIRAFAALTRGVIQQLNRAPEKRFLEFLNMLGTQLRPARPARVSVQFTINPGLEAPVLVPASSQLLAPADADRGDALFETTKDLLAVPSALRSVFAVDPVADAIYQPPPGFLGSATTAQPEAPYTTLSLSTAGSRTVQLDRVDGLAAGDVLRLWPGDPESGTDGPIHRVVAGDADGHLVPLTERLDVGLEAGTRVEKVADFRVFGAKNWQEHVLYLGHADLLDVESEALLTVHIQHLATPTDVRPLSLIWEYSSESEESDGVEWYPLLEEADTTAGFSQDGHVTLRKPNGPIAETEVDGRPSRWIRARVADPIPATPQPSLPRLDALRVLVKSDPAPGQDLVPDLAFHNDTPLELPYRPFGDEPRQFDRFYIASKEAFSKEEADITLALRLAREPLATPSAVALSPGFLHHLSQDPNGRLVEFQRSLTTTDSPRRILHAPLGNTRIASGSIPAPISAWNDSRFMTFVRAANGELYNRYTDPGTNQSFWASVGAPSSQVRCVFDPVVLLLPNGVPRVFTVGSNGQLYHARINLLSGGRIEPWIQMPSFSGGVQSTPTIVRNGADVFLYAADKDGHLHEATSIGGNWARVDIAADAIAADVRASADRPDLPERSRVFAQAFPEGAGSAVRLAYRDSNDRLIELNPDGTYHEDLNAGFANGAAPVVGSAPSGLFLDPHPTSVGTDERRHLFVAESIASKDGSTRAVLWERTSEAWIRHPHPAGTAFLRADPSAIPFLQTVPPRTSDAQYVSAFLQDETGVPFEFRRGLEPARTVEGGPNRIALLPGAGGVDSAYGGWFVRLQGGTVSPGRPREILTNSAQGAVVLLEPAEPAWPETPNETFAFQLLRRITEGQAPAATGSEISVGAPNTIDAELSAGRTVVVRMSPDPIDESQDQYRTVTGIDIATGVATVDPPWAPDTNAPVGYAVYVEEASGMVGARTPLGVVLDSASSTDNDFYTTADLSAHFVLLSGASSGRSGTITEYAGQVRVAFVERWDGDPPPPQPSGGEKYQIVGPHEWIEYDDDREEEPKPRLSWEYWNGRGWIALRVTLDTTAQLMRSGSVEFRVPESIEPTIVAGQENSWIRARLIGGDYGRETITTTADKQVKIDKNAIEPPLIESLTISYALRTPVLPEVVLATNNLATIDETATNRSPGKRFEPFRALEDDALSLYLGFEEPLVGGPIGVLFAADELVVDETDVPEFDWTFRTDNDWHAVQAEDGSAALARTGITELNVPDGFQLQSLFGVGRYWVRGALVKGRYLSGRRPRVTGIFTNAVPADHAVTVTDEILGNGSGDPDQVVRFLPAVNGDPPIDESVVGRPEIRVREFLTPEEEERLGQSLGPGAVLELDVLGERQTWVLWEPVADFFRSHPEDRHYRLDAARAAIQFGDGRHGRVVPAGVDNIRAFRYRSGGGIGGNLGPGAINALVSAIAGVDAVSNPTAAGGGGNTATVDEMLRLGPARLSHRNRAVTAEDFEWLAREASGIVARARCRPNFRAAPPSEPERLGSAQAGWVTVYIIPHSTAREPQPTLELQRAVERFLLERADAGVGSSARVVVRGPRYVPVSVTADVFATSLDRVAAVDRAVAASLSAYLHPLSGGADGCGWAFGRPLAVSDIARELEAVDGVDHIENLTLAYGTVQGAGIVEVEPDQLIAWADPAIRVASV